MTLTVKEFYAESHHGNPFGTKGPAYGPTGHRGDDTNGWPAGTPIPSFVSGTVVRSERQAALGWVVVVYSLTLKMWFGFCHLQSQGAKVGTEISVGESIGPLGTTGTLSTGNHVHVTASKVGSNPATSAVVDPRPYINAAKLTPAGGGTTPIPTPRKKKGKHMHMVHDTTSNPLRFLLFDDLFYLPFTGQAAADALSVQCGGNSAPVNAGFFTLIKAQVDLNRQAMASGGSAGGGTIGDSVQMQKLIDEVSKLTDVVVDLPNEIDSFADGDKQHT